MSGRAWSRAARDAPASLLLCGARALTPVSYTHLDVYKRQLQHVAGSAADVKRDLSASAGDVRVMTVHGSKGLEAKIVILADLGVEPGARRLPKILAVPTPSGELVPLWPPASAEDVQATEAAKAAVVAQMVEELSLIHI